jgi:hypothetical protein
MTVYGKSSPYYNTEIVNNYLDVINFRDIPKERDDILFEVYAMRNGIKAGEKKAAREAFFSKGQAGMRASPLTKRYGWGVHNNEEGKIALVPAGSAEYKKLMADKALKQTKGMRSSRG